MILVVFGGVWRFFLRVFVIELEVDDMIIIDFVGLNKELIVGFRMMS